MAFVPLVFEGYQHLEATARKRVSASSCFFGRLGVAISGLLSLLLRSECVDFLARLEQAAVVLLLNLGANVVECHECGSSLKVIVNLEQGG